MPQDKRPYTKRHDPTGHAAAVFGKTLCTCLEVLDMTDPAAVERVIRQLVLDRTTLDDLARQAEVLGAGALARHLRTMKLR